VDTPNLHKISDSDLGNSQVRELASRTAREFDRLVGVFNKALTFKDRNRTRLQAALTRRTEQIRNNFNSLQTVLKNIELYDQNLRKINLAVVHLQQKEVLVKNKYQTLLHGATRDELIEEVEGDVSERITREKLVQRRRMFLNELDKTFCSLEEELLTIETYKKEMLSTQAQLIQRRDKAIHLQVILEEKRKLYNAELKNLEATLMNSVEEENALIQILQERVEKIKAQLDLPEDVDQKLFSFLASLEAGRDVKSPSQELPVELLPRKPLPIESGSEG